MQRQRALPAPAYRRGTPSTEGATLTPATLSEAAMSPEAVAFVVELLGKLTPSEETAAQQAHYQALQEQFGIAVRVERPLASVEHVFTHRRLLLHVIACRYVRGAACPVRHSEARWVSADEIDQLAVARVDQKALAAVCAAWGW